MSPKGDFTKDKYLKERLMALESLYFLILTNLRELLKKTNFAKGF